MKVLLKAARLVLVMALIGMTTHVNAAPIAFTFTANVVGLTEWYGDVEMELQSSNFGGSLISFGDIFTGKLVIDSDAPMTTTEEVLGLAYTYTGGANRLTFWNGADLIFNSSSVTGRDTRSIIFDRQLGSFGRDLLRVINSGTNNEGMFQVGQVGFYAPDTEQFSGPDLPNHIDLNDYDLAVAWLNWIRPSDNAQLGITATITSIRLAPATTEVPEPASWGYWLLAGVIMVGLRRKSGQIGFSGRSAS